MTSLGEWIKTVPPFRAALGFFILVITASFSLGAASVNFWGLPQRISQLETSSAAAAVERGMSLDRLDRHIRQDSIATARIYCVVRLMVDAEGPINPLACENIGGDAQ
jgi:hypothetical protein